MQTTLVNSELDNTLCSQGVCFHCLEKIPKYSDVRADINGVSQAVCCYGCKSAVEFICNGELDEFYLRRERSNALNTADAPLKAKAAGSDWSFLDDENCSSEYVEGLLSGERSISVSVQGIYCSSCSWLIHQAFAKLHPNVDVHVNLEARRLVLNVFDPKVKIAELLNTVQALGYQPEPIQLNSDAQNLDAQIKYDRQTALKRIAVAGFGMMQVMTYAVAIYFGEFQSIDETFKRFLSLVSLLVATIVIFYAGKPFFDNAWNDIKNRRLGMDVPIALAIGGAYFPSVYLTLLNLPGHIYFDSAVMFIFFLSVGRFVEMRARHRLSGSHTALAKLLPLYVKITRQISGKDNTLYIKPGDVQLNDRVVLADLDTAPFDGIIKSGTALLDESMITGEAIAIERHKGEQVSAGSVLIRGGIEIEATSLWNESSIAKIERLLNRSEARGNEQQSIFSSIAHYFVFFVLVLTLVVAVFWWMVSPDKVFQIVLAMLVASCPCAFALAGPIGATAASHALRKKGLLLTNFKVLKLLPKLAVWCFDKTGTITEGKPKITSINALTELSPQACMGIAATLEQNNNHVLSHAFRAVGGLKKVDGFEQTSGNGVAGEINGMVYYLGKPEWVAECCKLESNSISKDVAAPEQNSVVALANGSQLLAHFYIQDRLRPNAIDVVKSIQAQGEKVVLLSGDRLCTVKSVNQTVQANESFGDMLPQQKLEYVQQLQRDGKVVAMVGDGVNDAPVISQADVSIAMASGNELSHSQADVIVLNGRLDSLMHLQEIANKANSITRQNLVWAITYNALALPLAAAGLLTPWLAALGMSISSLSVVLNALRIGRNSRHKSTLRWAV